PLGGLLDQLGEMGLRLVQAHGFSHRRGFHATTHVRTIPHLTKLVNFSRRSPPPGSSSTLASHISPAPPRCTPARAASSPPVAALDASLENRFEARLLAVEYPGRAGYLQRFHASDLRDASFRREVTAQDRKVSLGI